MCSLVSIRWIECDKTPLDNILDGLYSLVSSRGANWKWLRDGKPGHYVYTLIEGDQAKRRTERYRALSDRTFRDFIGLMRSLASMEPKERSSHKREIRTALKLPSEEATAAFLDWPGFWSEARLLFGLLSPQQLETLFDGGQPSTFRIKDLSPELQSQFGAMFAEGKHSRVLPDGSIEPLPEPEEFVISMGPLTTNELAPVVWIHFKDSFGGMSLAGTTYPGYAIRKTIADDWILPGDMTDDPAADRAAPAPIELKTPPAQRVTSDGRLIDVSQPGESAYNLMEMARGTSIPLLAILPVNNDGFVSKPYNQHVRAILSMMERGLHLVTKWRGGVLLVNHPEWFAFGEPAVPMKWLSLLDRGETNPASAADLAQCCARIDDAQAAWLGTHRGLPGFPQLLPLLVYAWRHQTMLTANGYEVGTDDLPFFRALRYLPAGMPVNRPIRLRVMRAPTNAGLTAIQLLVERYDAAARRWVLTATLDPTQRLSIPRVKGGPGRISPTSPGM